MGLEEKRRSRSLKLQKRTLTSFINYNGNNVWKIIDGSIKDLLLEVLS